MKLDHAALLISDPERSRAFYVGVLGLKEVARPETFTFPGLWLQIGDQQLHLIGEAVPGRARQAYSPEELGGGFTSHFAIEVDDLHATIAALQQRGGALVGGPRPRGDGVTQAYISDPDGHVVELMQLGG
jgi:catechol 2,3-dioxygenase-like lactoylglutathione lyase family enzyme